MKVFGLKAETGRWLFVIFGLIINLCLGSIYSWSVFRKPLEDLFAVGATESLIPFILFLAFFAILMPLTGSFLDNYGPRIVTIVGGIIVGIGWILGSRSSNMTMLALCYGVIGGAGVGIAYNCPIGVSGRWFPDKRGLAVGLTVLGFGLSPLITAPLAQSLIRTHGPLDALAYLGSAFLVLIVLFGLTLRFPPPGWVPEGWAAKGSTKMVTDFTRGEMVRTGSFWGLWLCYTIGTLAGLMAIGIASPVGQEVFNLNAATAALAVAIFAIFNGLGRPLFGYLVDTINARNTAILSFIIILVAAICLGFLSKPGATALYMVCFSLLWLCLGGWLAIGPAATAAFFGTRYYGPNYGLVYTAYGAGAIIGNLLAGSLRDITGSYVAVFYPVALLAALGAVIALVLMKSPQVAERTVSAGIGRR